MLRTFLRMFTLAFFVLVMLGLGITANAQFRASVQGTVTDVAGAVVADATVTLASKETGRTQQVQTSDGGFYRFSSLAPGLYSITVEKADFKKNVTDNVRVDAESTKGVDLSLEAGVISEVITVEAENEGLQTEDATIGKTISTQEVLSLPQVGRDPYELLRLAPGIFGSGSRNGEGNSVSFPNSRGPGGSNSSIFQTENQQPISANGQRVTSNNYQIDGTSVNAQRWGGAAIITPSQEAVKELQVSSSTYSAEDGRNSGAQIKVITQNGTNNWHGSVFYKYNDPSLNAFNKFPQFIGTRNTNRGPERVERKFKGFGGSVGGPIYLPRFGEGGPAYSSGKDKLFFFFAYEGTRDNTNNPNISWTETADYRQRVIAARPGTVTAQILSAPGGEPRVLEVLTPTFNAAANRFVCGSNQLFIPAQAVSGGIDFGSIASSYGQYVGPDAGAGFDGFPDLQCARIDNTVNVKNEQYFARIDFNATKKDKLAFTSFFTPSIRTGVDGGAQSRPQSDFSSDRFNFAIGAIYIRTFSPTAINEARFNYSGWGFNEIESNSESNFGLPRVEIEAIWGDRLRWGIGPSSIFDEKSLDFRDIFTKITGNHVLKFGGAFRRDLNKSAQVNIARPSYSFLRSWNFANGAPIFEFLGADANGNPTPNNTTYH
nr:TonB-dependent receptor [Pyrinomonadaceae bacterium]